ncbi:sensor histidine kinase [Tepidibacter hydrothermalis]|uniref:histidine kinase n=1 Tax=Tepidibacter hydrothermalis TaxID=3036126 RepID=A0ABY8EAA2_9FIRM|nr:HAMP domain-containing sensor histidine kinase [Tepidibacter hydrothermalis]WFD09857.1 HAMP domain-containing sensor histidine kinase [Tepidibacter hydrothermalis]
MKFWKKIFVYSLVLFLIVFNIGGIFLLENSHNLSLNREIERGLSEHSSIYSGVKMIIKDRKTYSQVFEKNVLEIMMKRYLESSNDEKIYIEILDKDNNEIFSNIDMEIEGERVELKNPLVDRRRYIIRDVGDQTFLYITNLLKLEEGDLKFSYVRDITYLYEDRKKQYYFFIQLELISFVLLAVGMYFLSKYITKPIHKLIHATQIITNGSYSETVNINTEDEVGILASNFNKMATAVEEKINELEKSANKKQRFIDNFTHEIKTPLTSIIGYADFLLATKYNEEIFIKGMNHILNEGKQLEKLSIKMMDLVLLKKEDFDMKNENLEDILLEIKQTVTPKLEGKNINLNIYGNGQALVERDLVKTLIANLIDNAIKASYENSKIDSKLYKDEDNKTVLEIKDEGIGIDKEDLEKVLEPFYMVDKSRTRKNNGAGLGLSICSEISKIHKAKLRIESKINYGTVVRIIFP